MAPAARVFMASRPSPPRMTRALVAALLAVPLFVGLSGCASCASGPPVSARGIAEAPSEAGGLGGFDLEVLVTEGPGGPPLPGAGVVVYWSRTSSADWEGGYVEVDERGVRAGGLEIEATPEAKSVERTMSDETGRVHVRLPTGRVFGVVAAKDGFTEEWLPALASGGSGSARIELPLFPQRVAADLDALWGPGGASTGTLTQNNYLWDPHPLPFANGTEAERAYAARIVELTVSIAWVNGPTTMGDLAVGIGPPDEQPALFEDGDQNVAAGEQTESATFDVEDLVASDTLGSPGIRVGAASDSGYFAPMGLPYRIHVEAVLDAALGAFGRCIGLGAPASGGFGGGGGGGGPGASVPGVGAVGLALALVVAAGIAQRHTARRKR